MNQPLPRVSCQKCNLLQDWRSQKNCIHCGAKMNAWHVSSQIKAQNPSPETVNATIRTFERQMVRDPSTTPGDRS